MSDTVSAEVYTKNAINIVNWDNFSGARDFPASVGETRNGEKVLELSYANIPELVGLIIASFTSETLDLEAFERDNLKFSIGAKDKERTLLGSYMSAVNDSIVFSTDAELGATASFIMEAIAEIEFAKLDTMRTGRFKEDVYDIEFDEKPYEDCIAIMNVDTGHHFVNVPAPIKPVDGIYSLAFGEDNVDKLIVALANILSTEDLAANGHNTEDTVTIRVKGSDKEAKLVGAKFDKRGRLVFQDEWNAILDIVLITEYLAYLDALDREDED